MAKTKLKVNREEFQKVVNDLESRQTFENPSHLWKALEQTEWAKSQKPRPITAAVAYVRAKELKIQYQTKPGKRGRAALTDEQKARMQEARKGARRTGKEKMAPYVETFEQLRKEVPDRYQNLVDRAAQGSKTAMIKLKCLDCCTYQTKEITHCTCTGCSLYPVRPYQGGVVVEAEEITTEEFEEEPEEITTEEFEEEPEDTGIIEVRE